jgi:hypothetical protein
MIATLEEFKKALNLEKIGFAPSNDYTYFGENYKKSVNDAIIYIDFIFEKGVYRGISANICLEEIESLTQDFSNEKNHLTITHTKLATQTDHIYIINKDVLDTTIKTENLLKTSFLINEYLTLRYKPFWEKYSVLQTVNDEIIDKVEQMKLSDYIPFQTPWKKLAIMKICKNPNYQSYVEWLDSVWVKKGLSEDLSQNETYLAYQKLLKKLETR